MYRHTQPQNFPKSGFDYDRPGFRHLNPEPVVLTQTQIDRAVANAVGVSAPQAETELTMAGSSETEVLELAAEPEVSDAESEPDAVQASAEPDAPGPDLQERATAYARKLAGALWDGIQNYRLPSGDEGLRSRRSELFDELLTIIANAGEFFSAAHVVKMADFAEQHESVRLECRATIERIEDLQKKIGPVDGQLRSKQNKSSEARVLLRAEEESKPKPDRYPSSKEIKAWESRVEKARADLDAALAEQSAVNAVRNDLLRAIRQERELLNGKDGAPGLKQKELDLRAAKDGKPRRDYETGFEIPAEF
jgi:hypothetical protein